MSSEEKKEMGHKAQFSEKNQIDKDYDNDKVPKACDVARSFITTDMKRFLDVGCGPGYFGKMVKDMQEAYVVGLEFTEKAAEYARRRLDEVHTVDVEKFVLPYEKQHFDCIAYLDILEHLIDPWEVLKGHRQFLKNDGVVIASIPNIRNLETIAELVQGGSWTYKKEGGILDVTHLRFFTLITINELFDQAGYKITSTKATSIPLYYQWISRGKPQMFDLGTMTIRLNQDVGDDYFVSQYVVKAERTSED